MSSRIGTGGINAQRLVALDMRVWPDHYQFARPAASRPWEDGRLWTRSRGIGHDGVGAMLGLDAMTSGVWAGVVLESGGPNTPAQRIAWFGMEALFTADDDAARVAWFGMEVIGPLEDREKVAWFGMEALFTADDDAARVAWFGMEVLTTGRIVVFPEPLTIPDDGGLEMSATSPAWPAEGVFVYIDLGDGSDLIPCYSGVVGNEFLCVPVGTLLSWVAPPLPVGGPFSVYFVSPDGDDVFEAFGDGLTVVRRSYTTNLYSLRALFPPPRDVGAYTLSDEES